MENLNYNEVITRLKELLGEDIEEKFEEQMKDAGEHGNPSFTIGNNEGDTAEVFVDWDKEADVLSYSINQETEKE